jgi:hypothetical protein
VEDLVALMLILVLLWVLVSLEAPKLEVALEEMREEVVMPLQLEGANHQGVGPILAMVHRARNYR